MPESRPTALVLHGGAGVIERADLSAEVERGIRADLSIIKGWKADESGNLIFRKTSRNFNQPAVTTAKLLWKNRASICGPAGMLPVRENQAGSGRCSVPSGSTTSIPKNSCTRDP